MEIVFSDSTGFHQEKANMFWLARRSKTTIKRTIAKPEPTECVLALKFTSGPAELYCYFPFLVHIYLNGRCCEILEFTAAFESREVFIKLSSLTTELCVHCEQGTVPAKRGISPDERELAVIMEWEVRQLVTNGMPSLKAHLPPKSVDPLVSLEESNVSGLARPVFVIGMYRSGTSILTWALGRHPNIFPIEETGWLGPTAYGILTGLELAVAAKRSFLDVYDLYADEMLASLGGFIDRVMRKVAAKHVRRTYIARLSGMDREFHPDFAVGRSLEFSYNRWVDGTPENTGYAYLLSRVFPLGRFIHIFRHPIDVVSSMIRFDRVGGEPMSINEALDFWLRFTKWGMHLALAAGSDVVKTVPYQLLVEKPGIVLDELFSFLGEPRFHQAEGIFRNRINSSKVTPEDRELVTSQLAAIPQYEEAQKLYETCLKLASLKRIFPNQESKRVLEEQINDVKTSLMNIFTGQSVQHEN